MKIAICGSLNFTYEIGKLAKELELAGFEVEIPFSSRKILNGELTLEEITQEKKDGRFHERAIKFDSIRMYWEVVKGSDAVLVANFEKNGVKNYIGGNAFLEMGFAHVLNKKIYILNNLPEISYIDEIRGMRPIILSGDLTKLA